MVEDNAPTTKVIFPLEQAAAKLGLDSATTWGEIADANREKARQEALQRLGLGADATWTDIADIYRERSRKAYAQGLDLDPETATWTDIADAQQRIAK